MIKINNLSYKFREGNIGLSNINLEFNRGEVVMIIGTNGSGKSTLLSAIANLIKYKGSIKLDDKEIKKIKNKEFRKRVGIVFSETRRGSNECIGNNRIVWGLGSFPVRNENNE